MQKWPRYPQHKFAKLDPLAEDELVSTLGIAHVPTLLLYQDGILLFNQASNFDEPRLEDIIAQSEALDMDMVRTEIERERSEAPRPQGDGL